MVFYYSHIAISLGTLVLICSFTTFFLFFFYFFDFGLYALLVIESIRYGDTR